MLVKISGDALLESTSFVERNNMEFKEKTVVELNTLSDRNLLAYYRAERNRFGKFKSRCMCCDLNCDLVWNMWTDEPKYIPLKEEYNRRHDYLKLIKSILSTRGHVEKSKK